MNKKKGATAAEVAIVQDSGKAARVEQERARLMELFTGADANKLDFIRDHVQQLAWLGITIIDLQSDIDEKGPVLPFINGETQKGWQANPACKTLKDFQTLYNAQFKALLAVLPEKPQTSTLELFKMEFEETEEEKQANYEKTIEEIKAIRRGNQVIEP